MADIVRAELFKLRKRPAVWVLLAAGAILNQVFGYLIPYLAYRSGDAQSFGGNVPRGQVLASTLPDQLVINTIGGFPVFAGALALVFGALMFGSEYGWGTVKTVLTQRPRRTTVLAGQVFALGGALFVGLVVLFMLGAATSGVIALAEGQSTHWPGPLDLAEGFGVGWLVLLMWALIGAALAVTFRGVALPIGLGVVWVLGVENLVSAMAGSLMSSLRPLRDLLPGVNAGSLVSAAIPGRVIDPPPGVTSSVVGSRAMVTLVGYVVACAVLAVWASRRRDVV